MLRLATTFRSTAPPPQAFALVTKADATPSLTNAVADSIVTSYERTLLGAFVRLQDAIEDEVAEVELTEITSAGFVDSLRSFDAFKKFLEVNTPSQLYVALAGTAAVANRNLVAPNFVFDYTSPHAIRWAIDHAGDLVTSITENTRGGINSIIERAFTGQRDVPTTARDIRRRLAQDLNDFAGLTERDFNAVVNYETRLIAEGVLPGKAESLANKLAERYLRNRSETIARTEILRASNEGQIEFWRQTGAANLFNLSTTRMEWVMTDDELTCRLCQEMVTMEENQNVLVGGMFTTPDGERVSGPPLHPNCRCTTSLIFESSPSNTAQAVEDVTGLDPEIEDIEPAVEEAEEQAEEILKGGPGSGNPDQVRDEHGRWTSGGGGDTEDTDPMFHGGTPWEHLYSKGNSVRGLLMPNGETIGIREKAGQQGWVEHDVLAQRAGAVDYEDLVSNSMRFYISRATAVAPSFTDNPQISISFLNDNEYIDSARSLIQNAVRELPNVDWKVYIDGSEIQSEGTPSKVLNELRELRNRLDDEEEERRLRKGGPGSGNPDQVRDEQGQWTSGGGGGGEPLQSGLTQEEHERFEAVARAQRGEPEQTMLNVQFANHGGALHGLVEHVGDITHRMTENSQYVRPGGYEIVKDKVEKTLYWLTNPYGFEREHNENLRDNADYNKVDRAVWKARVDSTLKDYAEAHRKIPVFNEAQETARNAAVAVGEQDWDEAIHNLRLLKEHLDQGRDHWREYAGRLRKGGPGSGNPDQARDEQGQWTSGGGGESIGGVSKPPPYSEFHERYEAAKTDEEKSALYAKRREHEKAWEDAVRVQIALGKIDPREATDKLGVYASEGWKPLPETLYHVTGNAAAIEATGIKTREELGMESGAGLGGGASDTISFTDDPELARSIERGMREAQTVARGEFTAAQMMEMARNNDFPIRSRVQYERNNLSLEEIVVQHWSNDWRSGNPYPDGLRLVVDHKKQSDMQLGGTPPDDSGKWSPAPSAHEISPGKYLYWERDMTPTEARDSDFQFYKWYSMARESKGGPFDPLFFSSDVDALARSPDIAILEYTPQPGAQGYPQSGMREWRTTTGRAVKLKGRTR